MKCLFGHNYVFFKETENHVFFHCSRCPDVLMQSKAEFLSKVKNKHKQKVIVLDELTPSDEEDLKQPSFISKVLEAINGRDNKSKK